MANSLHRARFWTEFLASRPDFKPGHLLLQHFAEGEVTRLCDCGCNSYDFVIAENSEVAPLAPPHEHGGCAFQTIFETQPEGKPIEFRVSVDGRGNLCGLDVEFAGNHEPVPDNPVLAAQPFHTAGPLKHVA